MAEPILCRETVGGSFEWLDLPAVDRGVQSGTLQALAQAAEQREVCAVWPAEAVLLLELDLPLRSFAQIKQALPFALEDYLADGIEQYHWVWQRPERNGPLAVALVDRAALAVRLQRFAEAGIQVSQCLPEPLLLPLHAGQTAFAADDAERAVLRYGRALGGGGDRQWLWGVLQRLYQEGKAEGECRLWSRQAADAAEFVCVPQEWRQPLLLYREQLAHAAPFNLLSGEFALKNQSPASLRSWAPALLILTLAGALQVAGQWYLAGQQQRQLAELKAQSQTLFTATFPEVKRLVNLKIQADQQLDALNSQAQLNQSGFLRLLYDLGSVVTSQVGGQLHTLVYVDGRLQVGMRLAQGQTPEILQQALEALGRSVQFDSGSGANSGEVSFALH
ncbi:MULTISPECIES: type II secretion system protein GspL [Methylomonas]|uniref:type II secretion system protein GspL n=1 Tax=Methylomonas TaxID=416 RepID=UPI00123217F7|nr:type II secretion system protein GspL [Methylomonas rhizoryzae]